jgi:tRNA 2-thiocytidine biosynthesis protein TtcA
MTRLHRILIDKIELAVQKYDLIQSNDRILIGISGGKDSFVLWQLLCDIYSEQSNNAELFAAFIDAGFPEKVPSSNLLAEYFIRNDQTIYIKKEYFGPEAVEKNQTKNPCFICSRARRKSLVELAKQLNCNKIALAHHRDDVIETLLLNIFYSREISTMLPKQSFFDGKFHIIRPLWEIEEKLIENFAKEQQFPLIKNPCQISGKSKREKIKEIIINLEAKNKTVKDSIFQSLFHVNTNFLPKS